jgi:acyl-coenzyme A synthetase/AMP-(fatty) acid ligase
VFVPELPRGATGKIKRRDAVALFSPVAHAAGGEAAA